MRKIIHIDMDCFYAAVEMKHRPELRDKPIAVGGSPERRGVVATANYEARKYGVRSAMSSRRALQLCPDLILISGNYQSYKDYSQKIRGIFAEFTEIIEPLSLDEAYLDVSDSEAFSGSATLIAKEIRKRIYEDLGLTASAGVAPNKFLAKVASEWNKPNGQLTISPNDVSRFVKKLPVKQISGVGKVTAQKMHKMGIFTCNDLQKYSRIELTKYFGKWGLRLFDICRGNDDRPVKVSRIRKSLSIENTYSVDLKDNECKEPLLKLYESFLQRWERANIEEQKIKAHIIKVKYFDFKQTTHEKSLAKMPSAEDFINLFENIDHQDKKIRLLGLGVKLASEEKSQPDNQLNLF